MDLALSGPGHPGQPILPGVVCSATLSLAPGKATASPIPQLRGHPALLGSDSIAVVRDRAWLGEGNSYFRFIMCVIRSDLTHNLPFYVTDNILGAGDTSILVLPSLEVNVQPHLDDDVSSSLPVKPRARAPHRTPLPHLESGTCTQDLSGEHGGSRYTSLRAADHRRSVR